MAAECEAYRVGFFRTIALQCKSLDLFSDDTWLIILFLPKAGVLKLVPARPIL